MQTIQSKNDKSRTRQDRTEQSRGGGKGVFTLSALFSSASFSCVCLRFSNSFDLSSSLFFNLSISFVTAWMPVSPMTFRFTKDLFLTCTDFAADEIVRTGRFTTALKGAIRIIQLQDRGKETCCNDVPSLLWMRTSM
jgi:hypothetical protein